MAMNCPGSNLEVILYLSSSCISQLTHEQNLLLLLSISPLSSAQPRVLLTATCWLSQRHVLSQSLWQLPTRSWTCRSGEQYSQTSKDFSSQRNARSHACVLSPSPAQFGFLLIWPTHWTEHSLWADFLQLLQTLRVTTSQGFCTLSSLCQMLFPQEISWGKSPSSLFKCLHLREVFLRILPSRAS